MYGGLLCFLVCIYRRKSHETDLPAEQGQAEPQIRVSRQNENKGRKRYSQAPQGKRPVQTHRFRREEALLTNGASSRPCEHENAKYGHERAREETKGANPSLVLVKTLKREERLKKRGDIKKVFSRGKRLSCRGAKLFVLQNNLPYNRICFTFSRGFGNAVKRNRAKRLGREAYRSFKPQLNGGHDMVLLVYPEDAGATFARRVEQLRILLGKAGVLQ